MFIYNFNDSERVLKWRTMYSTDPMKWKVHEKQFLEHFSG